MKKLNHLLLAAAGCLALVSCSKDDDNNPGQIVTENMTGSYELTSAYAPSEQDYDNDGDRSTNLVLEGSCYNDSWISFHEDGTYDQGYHSSTTAAGGQSLECNTEITSGTYTRNGSVIQTHVDGGTEVTATYTYNATTHTLSGTDTTTSYAAWNAATSLWATLTGSVQLTYTKYTDNDDDNGASSDTDGPDGDDNNANLAAIGTFGLTSYIVAIAQDIDRDGDNSTNLATESVCYGDSNLTLNADGTYAQNTSTNVLANSGLSLTCNTETTTGTWTRLGNTITTHRTSSGSGSVNVTYNFDAAAHTLLRTESAGAYPNFNLATSIWSMVNGTVSTTYTRS